MESYSIRKYEDKDYEAVRAIFSLGIKEHAPAGFRHILRCIQTYLLVLGVFLAAYAISSSFLFSFGVAAGILVLGWIRMKVSALGWLEQPRNGLPALVVQMLAAPL
uniref:Uncharacterized protein n=1 Tax=Salvator merianae TaxID=96440 RepID=A0A8D0AY32_SALMN